MLTVEAEEMSERLRINDVAARWRRATFVVIDCVKCIIEVVDFIVSTVLSP